MSTQYFPTLKQNRYESVLKGSSYSRKADTVKSRNKYIYKQNTDISGSTLGTPSIPRTMMTNVYTASSSCEQLPGLYNSNRPAKNTKKMYHSKKRGKQLLDPVLDAERKMKKNFKAFEQINESKKKIIDREIFSKKQAEQHHHVDYTEQKKPMLPPDVNDKYISSKVNEIKYLKNIRWDTSSPRFARA